MKLIKPKDWERILLPVFLLIIMIQGVMQLPEVRVRFFPEKVWQDRFSLIARGCVQIRGNLIALDAELAALNFLSEPSFFSYQNYFGNGWITDFCQWVVNGLRLKVGSPDQNSFERHHYLARRKFFHAEMKLKYLEPMLENLRLSTTSQGIDGAPNFRNHDSILIQNQIYALRQQCQQYEDILDSYAKRLQKLRELSDKQIILSDKPISTKNW